MLAFWLVVAPAPMSTTDALILVAVINGVFGLTAAGAAFWTAWVLSRMQKSTKAIESSVNGAHKHMVQRVEAQIAKVNKLQKTISLLLVERAKHSATGRKPKRR